MLSFRKQVKGFPDMNPLLGEVSSPTNSSQMPRELGSHLSGHYLPRDASGSSGESGLQDSHSHIPDDRREAGCPAL